ncbi:flagellin [Sphingobium sp.]|uniref:flagellin N-terminal helical domain-containing protein n=1 Tax=Sphingobium sp. TaxID=1912891 RepID=UPI002B72B587|nr:flagellin [Sphingobium sp.]HUD93296.1 flagellin [Sphingobium sp.]
MSVIGTNSAALRAQRAIETAGKAQAEAAQRLSTGKRINSAKDDAAGLAIASSMTSQIRGLEVGKRNAADAISLTQTAEGVLGEVENSLQRLRELSLQANNGVLDMDDRAALQTEFSQTVAHIDALLGNAAFNGIALFSDTSRGIVARDYNRDGDFRDYDVYGSDQDEPLHNAGSGTITVQAGPNSDDTVTITLPTLRSNDDNFTLLGTDIAVSGTMRFVGIGNIDLTLTQDVDVAPVWGYDSGGHYSWADPAGHVAYTDSDYKSFAAIGVTARTGLTVIDAALDQIATARIALGSSQRRLESLSAQMDDSIVNLTEARSRIEDADFSAETTALARSQILSQAATAMLAQANARQQDVLKLIE